MKVVLLFAAFVLGVIVCYLLMSLGVVDYLDGLPGTQEEPTLSLPTYLSFLSVMMTAVTAVLAAVAIGIGVVAAYTFREIKNEAQKIADATAQEVAQKTADATAQETAQAVAQKTANATAQEVADDRLSEVKVKGMVFDLYAKAEKERVEEWDEDPSEQDENTKDGRRK